MGLERKDVRAYLDAEMHAALTRICSHRGVTVADFVEALLVREIDAIGHDAIQLADELRDLGIFRKNPESGGAGRR